MESANGIRPTTGAAYTDGSDLRPPSVVRIERGADLHGERTVRADVCVIGTGAGGAVVAKELAEGGADVVVLEEGEHHTTDEYTARPREMTARLFRDAGQTVTLGNVPVVLPLGKAIGGSTLINSGTCFRTPSAVLDAWTEQCGLEGVSEQDLDPFFRRVERVLGVAQVTPELAGNNALVVKRGADALGWGGDFIFRNARGCVGSAVCQWGCPAGAKQHMGLSYVPLAWEAGATTWTATRASRIELASGRARAVEAGTTGGGRLRVECDTVIVAGGAIGTPLFLQKQRLGNDSGQLGHNLTIHPATGVRALFDEDINMAFGVSQSYFVDEFCDEGIMFEGAAGPPDYIAMSLAAVGDEHREAMLAYRRLSQFGLMVSDRTSRGSVRPGAGSALIRYDITREDVATFKRGIELLCELYWAAGAKVVYPAVQSCPELNNGEMEPLRGLDLRAGDLTLLAFHPLGTARADERPGKGVVDSNLKLRGTEGVWVADGSVVPSSLGVNPQITIMTLATRLAYHLLEKVAPEDEPRPEKIAQPRINVAHV